MRTEEIPPNTAMMVVHVNPTGMIKTNIRMNVNNQDTTTLRLLMSELDVVRASLCEEIRRRATIHATTGDNKGDTEDDGR